MSAAEPAETSVRHLESMTYAEVEALLADHGEAVVAILPVGAVEAHGPHLPLVTDRIIAQAMARDGAERLAAAGRVPVVLPPVDYTPAAFAAAFAGTVSIRPETARDLLVDIGRSLAAAGFRTLVFVNAHLDPQNLGAIRDAAEIVENDGALRVVFPDVTRKPWALRLTDEFKSGACHAGQYEGSVVMAERPDLVREGLRRALAANPSSLSVAIRDGKRDFHEAGGDQAYFGDPAAASVDEGRLTVAVLGSILAEAVLARD